MVTQAIYRVLIVDDNELIHQDFAKVLLPRPGVSQEILAEIEADLLGDIPETRTGRVALDLSLEHAYQGEEALDKARLAAEEGRPYALIFMDFRMPPGINGVVAIEKIWAEFPHIEMVMCTAYSDDSWDAIHERLAYSDQLMFVRKPFNARMVRNLTAALLRKWQRSQQERNQLTGNKIWQDNSQLIHMCMYCSKVKDEQEQWHQSDEFDFGQREVSHCMCPQCYGKAVYEIQT